MNNINKYDWVNFYEEFASKLLSYKNNRQKLLLKLQEAYKNINSEKDIKFPFIYNGQLLEDICPFTVFGAFNKGLKDENRIEILKQFKSIFKINSEVPTSFYGIPILNNMQAWFFKESNIKTSDDIYNLWEMFAIAIEFSSNPIEKNKIEFIENFNRVSTQHSIKWNLTMGLFWIRPKSYINLDETNRNSINYLSKENKDVFPTIKYKVPDGEQYLDICDQFKKVFSREDLEYKTFPEFSYYSWGNSKNINNTKESSIVDDDVKTTQYWMYSPGKGSNKWEEFYDEGIIAIGWDYLGDLTKFDNKESIGNRIKEVSNKENPMNDSLATWQFSREISEGDVIFAKRGTKEILGVGIVRSAYIYDNNRTNYKHIRTVDWIKKGEWETPDKSVVKTLTNITPYTDYVRQLEDMCMEESNIEDYVVQSSEYQEYTKNDFLEEVFIDETQYETLVNLLKNKKNIILQGAPGVGKTFAAKRLAYSIMGVKDINRVMMIQFHQSYSYEDFIMGFRPTENGFKLSEGPFYEFCKKAEADDDNDYFFIIDEINRGNLSKILGELLMLIEKDKRGEKLRLLYSNEQFSIPKNLHIIGMMNTADRSLAMIDYALRRRFAFYELKPAFDSEGFTQLIENFDNTKYNKLIQVVKELNCKIEEDQSLGKGFCIGHSYFCTKNAVTDEWIKSIVDYEIIPLIDEYWFDEKETVDLWSKKLTSAVNDQD